MIRIDLSSPHASEGMWYIVAPAATGVRYEFQTGGMACRQDGIEGAVVGAFRSPGLADLSCDIACWADTEQWSAHNVARVNNILDTIGLDWELDPALLSQSYEGWLWLRRAHDDARDDWQPPSAVAAGPNCD